MVHIEGAILTEGEAMDNGIKIGTVKYHTQGYAGRIAIYGDGKRLYSLTAKIMRVSRGDAKQDARTMAHDLLKESFLNGRPYQFHP